MCNVDEVSSIFLHRWVKIIFLHAVDYFDLSIFHRELAYLLFFIPSGIDTIANGGMEIRSESSEVDGGKSSEQVDVKLFLCLEFSL